MRIFAAEHHGLWSAWLEGSPEVAFGGNTAAMAVARLGETLTGFDVTALIEDKERTTSDRLVFLVGTKCRDCGGSGKHIGLTEVGVCSGCDGSGRK